MRHSIFAVVLGVCLYATAGAAHAQTTAFTPPNDPTGQVFSTNSNDGYGGGRGINFNLTADTTLDSVGIYQDLSNITLNYEVGQIPALGGSGKDNATVLRSGSTNVTTQGLQYIDFNFADLALTAGNNYYIQFQFDGNANQNFFYNNGNVTWTQGPFSQLDGFAPGASGQGNFVVSAIRLHEVNATATPEPGTWAMLVTSGLSGAGFLIRKRQRK